MKKFGVRHEMAAMLADCVNEASSLTAIGGFHDINRTQTELVAALTRKRTDGSVLLTQDELESALYAAVMLDEEGAWPNGRPPLSAILARTVPGSHRFDPYFCFILENKAYV